MELKPCPFCGRPVHLTYSSFSDEYHFWHKWREGEPCPVLEPIVIDGSVAKSLQDAEEAWNRRATNG